MNTYIGYAKDEKIRSKASSGGIVTALLIYLLRNKEIDGAIVCRMNGLDAEQFIATTEKEIINSSQSKYMDFPLNNIINKLKNRKGKFVIVGTSCQFMVLKRLKEFNKKIKYWFGLYCGYTMKKEGTLALLKKLKIKPEEVKKIEYRYGKGYGGFKVQKKDGTSKFVSKDSSNYLFTIYAPDKCFKCKDLFNEYSDISFGDCWFKKKNTSILVRTKKGLDLLKRADNIYIKDINKKKFFAQHSHGINLKKKRINAKKYAFLLEKLPFWLLSLMAKFIKIIKR